MLSPLSLLSSAAELTLFPVLLTCTIVRALGAFALHGFKPPFPTWTLKLAIGVAVQRFITARYGATLTQEPGAARFRRLTEYLGTHIGAASCRRHHTRVTPEIANGLEHLWITSSDTPVQARATNDRYVVLYFHGGGYVLNGPRGSIEFCNTLRAAIVQDLQARTSTSRPIQVDMFVGNYRKAPKHKLPAPADDALLVYEYLVKHHQIPPCNIILAGDSAGAGLVLSTLMRLRDGGKQHLMPLAAMLLCAYVDLTDVPADFVPPPHCGLTHALMDGFRRASLPDPDDAAEARRHSAAFADLRGLPPVLVQAATLDYLYRNSLDLLAKAQADGVANWETDIHDDMPHIFMTVSTSALPYAAVGVQRLAAYAAKQIQSRRA